MQAATETTPDQLETLSKNFIDNTPLLEDLSRKVSREGLRRIFIAVARFPYVGEEFKVTNVHESELLKQALYMKELASEITKLQPIEEAQEKVVDTVVENVLATMPQGETNG